MAQNKVRFSISIPYEANEALNRFVKVSGSTKSGFISEMLIGQIKVMNELSDAIELAKSGSKSGGDSAINALGESLRSLGSDLSDLD